MPENRRHVVVVGDLNSGIQTVHGPFEDEEHASQWASSFVGYQPHIILPLCGLGD